MSAIRIKLRKTEFDGSRNRKIQQAISETVQESLSRVSSNQAAILADHVIRDRGRNSKQKRRG